METDSSSQTDCASRAEEIQAVISEIQQFIQNPPKIRTPEELVALECKVEEITGKLAGLLVGETIPELVRCRRNAQ